MSSNSKQDPLPRILTNMQFWQSQTWSARVDSVYPAPTHRPYPLLKEAAALWRRNPTYGVVVTMGARESLAYGLLCALAARPSKQVMCEVFVDEAQLINPLWHLKVLLYRWVARRAMGILTNSSAEVGAISKRFGVPTSKLRYVPMHTNIAEPRMCVSNDGFVVSAGRTRRDYASLLAAAPKIKAPLVVLCGNRDLPQATAPSNVTVLHELPREQYLDYMARCAVVVLPLKATERSTGQVVLLEAMALGKAVVVTRATGTTDYIRNGENGLLVPACDPCELANAVNRLLDKPDEARQLAMNALSAVCSHYTFDTHAQAKLEAIRELWQSTEASG